MGLFRFYRNLYFLIPVGILSMLLLVACGSTTSTASPAPTATKASLAPATATAVESSLIQKMTFVGTATAKIVSGTTFEADGKITNGDSKQHDIVVQVTLLDAKGNTIASANKKVEDVHGNTTVSFAIQGTTPQATWSSVKVTVTKVTENLNGAGSD